MYIFFHAHLHIVHKVLVEVLVTLVNGVSDGAVLRQEVTIVKS